MSQFRDLICERCNRPLMRLGFDAEMGRWAAVKDTPPFKTDAVGHYFECPHRDCLAKYDVHSNPPDGYLVYRIGTGQR